MDRQWRGEDGGISPKEGKDDWRWDSSWWPRTLRQSLRASSPLSLSDLDLWEKKSHFKAQSSAWSCRGLSASGHRSETGTSHGGLKHDDSAGIRKWPSASRLAPEGAPWSHGPSQGAELRAALEESGQRRADLVQRLREAHGHLDTQTDLLKSRDTQLQHSQSTTQLLELKHKQLAEAVSALEQEKDVAELSRFEESRRRGELQDKMLQLEMDMLKMRSSLERGSSVQPSLPRPNSHLSTMLPGAQEDSHREGQKQTERELKKLREDLKEAGERAEALEVERDQVLQQLHSSKEDRWTALSQVEELNQRLSSSMQAQTEVQDQLSDSRSRLGQLDLERDLLSTKAVRLEDSLEDLKAKLSAALTDKDRLVQEKAELHQRAQGLELQLERAQRGREGFTQQVCELHAELAQAKTQANRHQQDTVLMKEETHTLKGLNEKLSSDFGMTRQRLEVALKQLHNLEAEKVIHTNQIAALETERVVLIGEKEELLDTFPQWGQEELSTLKERCSQLTQSQDTLRQKNQELQTRCRGLEGEVLDMEAGLQRKGEELHHLEVGMEQEKDELRRVAAHWNEKWLEVAMTLRSTQGELEEARKKQQGSNTLKDEAAGLADAVETLQTELKRSRDQIQTLLQQKANTEAQLGKVKKEAGALERVELDACRQQLELEKSRSQTLLQRLMGSPGCLEEVDGELGQMRAELQKVWDMLKARDTELEEQQQELQSARGQMSQQSNEVQRLEQQLAEREQDLRDSESALRSVERLSDIERSETQARISALEEELVTLREQGSGVHRGNGGQQDVQDSDTLQAELEESRGRAEHLQQDRDDALQRLDAPRQLQGNVERRPPLEPPKKEKPMNSDIDQDQQRRLVTEQLKSLFKEREKLGQAFDRSPGAQRRAGSMQDLASKSKVVKNALDTLSSQKKQQELLQESEHQQGAAETAGAGTGAAGLGAGDPERETLQEQVTRLRQELHSQTEQMTTMSVEMDNLKERNENLLKAKLRFQQQIQGLRATASQSGKRTSAISVPRLSDSTMERGGGVQGQSSLHCEDGTFLARQVEICDSEVEEEEEEEEEE